MKIEPISIHLCNFLAKSCLQKLSQLYLGVPINDGSDMQAKCYNVESQQLKLNKSVKGKDWDVSDLPQLLLMLAYFCSVVTTELFYTRTHFNFMQTKNAFKFATHFLKMGKDVFMVKLNDCSLLIQLRGIHIQIFKLCKAEC